VKHLDIRVSGTVQGVFFRVSTQRKARELGVAGSVRNEIDGSVFIEAEAEEAALSRFVDWCRRGPANARVRRIETTESEPRGYREFTITG
jgi:acylphosphatase